jgi:hypothetical protein
VAWSLMRIHQDRARKIAKEKACPSVSFVLSAFFRS